MIRHDPLAIVEVFKRHKVRFVVIGAFAALAHAAPIGVTQDIDLTPDRAPANLRRLSDALKELDARVRASGAPRGLPFDHRGESLGRVDTWNLVCDHGEFDIAFAPSAFPDGYVTLDKRASDVVVDHVQVRIAHLADVIKSKEEAGRPKDLAILPVLYRHLAAQGGDTPEH